MTLAEPPLPEDDGLDPSETRVFLSYSRIDREQAQRIADVLRARSFGVFRDTDDILPTEEWRERLEQLIEEADTIVFLMSPHSVTSEVCAWEVDLATSLNKRIAPIVIEDVDTALIPAALAKLNFIFCTERDPFENAVGTLISALNTDVEWIREHTRLATLARRWRKARSAKRLLLRGQDITDAEAWRDAHPKEAPAVTTDQSALIADSRRAASARQRQWVGGSLTITVGAAALAIFAYFQSVEADRQRNVANTQRVEADRQRDAAEAQRAAAERQKRIAQTTQSLFLSDQAQRELVQGRATNAIALAWEALPHDTALSERPITPEALHALRQGILEQREVMAIRPETSQLIHIAADKTKHRAFAIVDDRIEIWDLITATRRPFPANAEGAGAVDVGRIVISEDGNRLLARAYKPARLLNFDLNSGNLVEEIPITEGHVISIFAPNPGGAIIVYNRGVVHRIDPDGDLQALDFKADLMWAQSIDATADGRQVAFGDFEGQLYFLDYPNDRIVTPPKLDLGISALALGENGAVAAFTSGGDMVDFVRPENGESIVQIEPHSPVGAINFDAHSSTIWLGHDDGSLSQWSTELTELARFGAHDEQITDLHLGANGKWAMTIGLENIARVWRGWSDMSDAAWIKPSDHFSTATFTDNGGALLAEWPKTGPVTIISETGPTTTLPMAADQRIYDLGFSPDGARILISNETGRLFEWAIKDATLLGTYEIGQSTLGIEYTPDGSGALVLTSDTETIFHFSFSDGTRTEITTGAGRSLAASASLDGRVIVGDDETGSFAVHLQTGRRVAAPDQLSKATVHPNGEVAAGFVSDGGLDRSIAIWRTADGTVERVLPGLDHDVYGMEFSADGNWLGAMTGNGAYLWRTDGTSEPQRFHLGTSSLGIAFSGDGTVFGANSEAGVTRLWRTSDGAMIARLDPRGDPGTAVGLDLSKTGERVLVTTYLDDTTRLWEIERDPATLIELGGGVIETLAPLTFAKRCQFFLETDAACRSVRPAPR